MVENSLKHMNQKIESLYQEIGQEACNLAQDLNGKLLVYAELEDGVISPSLFYEKGANKEVIYKFSSDQLINLLDTLWQVWQEQVHENMWSAISYVIGNRKFNIDLTYPEQMEGDEEFRRDTVIEKCFGKTNVNYSNPD